MTDPNAQIAALAKYLRWALSGLSHARYADKTDTYNDAKVALADIPAAAEKLLADRERLVEVLERAPVAVFSARNVPEKREAWFRRHREWQDEATAVLLEVRGSASVL